MIKILSLALFVLGASPAARADGPGVPNLTYSASQVGKPLSVIKSAIGTSARGHANVAMVDGYLFVPFSVDEGQAGGGVSFYDISIPTAPHKVSQVNDAGIREAHGFGFSNSYPGHHYAVLQSTTGLQFWDFTDPVNPHRVSVVTLPGTLADDYKHAAWWAFWQAPYVYVGGGEAGVYIVDATDVVHPRYVKAVPTAARVGSTFAVGNLLVSMGNDVGNIYTFDISDPLNPVLLDTQTTGTQYSGIVNGNRVITSGNDFKMHVYGISNPANITTGILSPSVGDKGGYGVVQDNFFVSGFSAKLAKINLSTGAIVMTGSSGITGRDEDFGMALGNLAWVGSDHPVGSAIMPTQTAPDTTGPSVNMVSPKNGATGQRLTSRVGITLTDQIDLRTVDATTFIVRPAGGAALPGKYSGQTGVLNFTPDGGFAPGTTYEVVVSGLRDLVGNVTPSVFTSSFATAAPALVSGLSVADTANAADWSIRSNLQVGDAAYGDRTYTIAVVPASLAGAAWIRTANDSKAATQNPLATFTLGAPATVSVAVNASQARPSWLDASWTAFSESIVTRESSTTTRTFNVLQKAFPAGSVALGPWASSSSMYIVVVQ